MTTDKIKQFSYLLSQKGFPKQVIVEYFDVIHNDSDLDVIISYIKNNPNASNDDINYMIMKGYLKTRGISI